MPPFPPTLPNPDEVLEIARRLDGAGHAVWCVGGAVRDNLLGEENKDFDLATSATPQDVRKLFKRSIPVGIEHGTVAVLDRNKQPHEVTTFRKDVATDGRHAVVEFGVELEEDLARRDFTINAIAYQPLTHEWRDPHDGTADLADRLIRAVGDPAKRFQEDYLRILRMLRFAARFDFRIDDATWNAAKANVAGLEQLSAERVREEWMRGLVSAKRASRLVELWCEIGAVEKWLSAVRCALSAEGAVLDRFAVRDPVLMTAYLSSDPADTLARLRCSNADTARGAAIGKHRNVLPNPEDPVAVRRWMSERGEAVDDLVRIARAEGEGERLASAVAAVRATGAALTIGELAIGGADLMEAGIPEGPAVGAALSLLLGRVLQDPALNSRESLMALVADPEFQRSAHSAQQPGQRTAHRAQRTSKKPGP